MMVGNTISPYPFIMVFTWDVDIFFIKFFCMV